MKLALLGAGRIGQTIAQWLHQSGDYSVTVADGADSALAAPRALGMQVAQLSLDDTPALMELIGQHDAVINALPYTAAIPVAQACAATSTHYFDLTEDVAATRHIAALAATSPGTAFMPQCGLAPGFVGIAAHGLASRFDRLDEIKMRVGALPQYPNNQLKYNITWSPDGLINEYCQPCQVIRDGQAATAQPLDDLEALTIEGTVYEAFNTSGGLGTLCDTLAGKVRTLNYKSMRYPGHQALMRFLLEDLQFRHRQDELRRLLLDTIPATRQDMVIVFVAVSGWINDRYEQAALTRTILADDRDPQGHSAIQIATSAGVCACVDLFRSGELPDSGFIGQESVSLEAFLNNRFASAYRAARQTASK